MGRIKFATGEAVVQLHAAATTFDAPAAETDGGLYKKLTIDGYMPPDVLIRIVGAAAWTFDKSAAVFGMHEDGTWDRIEGPLGGAVLSGLAGIGQAFAVATGGYKRLALAAYDGTTLTASTAVSVEARPIFSKEI